MLKSENKFFHRHGNVANKVEGILGMKDCLSQMETVDRVVKVKGVETAVLLNKICSIQSSATVKKHPCVPDIKLLAASSERVNLCEDSLWIYVILFGGHGEYNSMQCWNISLPKMDLYRTKSVIQLIKYSVLSVRPLQHGTAQFKKKWA